MYKSIIAAALVISNFSVSASNQLNGYLISDVSQIDETYQNGHNAFGIIATSALQIEEVFNSNNGRMLPIIEMGYFVWKEDGTIGEIDSEIVEVLYDKKYIAYIDEPLWRIRNNCWNGSQAACSEVDSGYINTRAAFQKLKETLRVQVLWIEAWAELILQQHYQFGKVINIEAADYIGFDCYGPMHRCGNNQFGWFSHYEYAAWMLEQRLSNQKLFLVGGGILS